MLRKIFFILILLAVGVAAFIFYQRGGVQVDEEHPLSSVPDNAAVIFKSNDFIKLYHQLSETNLMWQELLGSNFFQNLDSNAAHIDSLLKLNSTIASIIEEEPMYASIHRTGKGKYNVLYSMRINVSEEELIASLPGFELEIAESRLISNSKIHTLKNAKNTSVIYLTFNRNVLNISRNVVLIEDAINQIASGNGLLKDRAFKSIMATSGKYVDANVFVNYENFNSVFASFLNPNFGNEFNKIEGFAEWAALDLYLKPNALMFNGFSNVPDSASSYLNCFAGQQAQDLDMLSAVPERASNIFCAGLSNFERYHDKYTLWLKRIGAYQGYSEIVKEINKELKLEIDEEWPEIMGNEMGIFLFRK